MQFVLLSDVNASDMVDVTSVPVFRDPSPSRDAWGAMDAEAVKHDTFVYDTNGTRTLYWRVGTRPFSEFSSDIRAAVLAASPPM